MDFETLIGSCHLQSALGPDQLGRGAFSVVICDLVDVPFEQWVFESTVRLLARLQADLTSGALSRRPTLVTVVFPDSAAERSVEAPHKSATVAAVQGLLQALIVELREQTRPINLSVVGERDSSSLRRVITFLNGPGGDFTTGQTFDLSAARPA